MIRLPTPLKLMWQLDLVPIWGGVRLAALDDGQWVRQSPHLARWLWLLG